METNHIRAKITDTIKDLVLPRYEEIPNVGLFLEQTVKYINGYLSVLPNMEITGSMISNYVKKGIIPSPVKKQYSREQIAHLMFIAVAKSVLTLEEIHIFIDIQNETYTSETAYNYFASELINMLSVVFELTDEYDVFSSDASFEKVMLRNTIITVAHKIYLDMFFTEVGHERLSKNEKINQ